MFSLVDATLLQWTKYVTSWNQRLFQVAGGIMASQPTPQRTLPRNKGFNKASLNKALFLGGYVRDVRGQG